MPFNNVCYLSRLIVYRLLVLNLEKTASAIIKLYKEKCWVRGGGWSWGLCLGRGGISTYQRLWAWSCGSWDGEMTLGVWTHPVWSPGSSWKEKCPRRSLMIVRVGEPQAIWREKKGPRPLSRLQKELWPPELHNDRSVLVISSLWRVIIRLSKSTVEAHRGERHLYPWWMGLQFGMTGESDKIC